MYRNLRVLKCFEHCLNFRLLRGHQIRLIAGLGWFLRIPGQLDGILFHVPHQPQNAIGGDTLVEFHVLDLQYVGVCALCFFYENHPWQHYSTQWKYPCSTSTRPQMLFLGRFKCFLERKASPIAYSFRAGHLKCICLRFMPEAPNQKQMPLKQVKHFWLLLLRFWNFLGHLDLNVQLTLINFLICWTFNAGLETWASFLDEELNQWIVFLSMC